MLVEVMLGDSRKAEQYVAENGRFRDAANWDLRMIERGSWNREHNIETCLLYIEPYTLNCSRNGLAHSSKNSGFSFSNQYSGVNSAGGILLSSAFSIASFAL